MKNNIVKLVSIGIPACNEENNIKSLLEDIIIQKQTNFLIKEIIVLSDGSSDNTVVEVKKVKDKRIKLIDGKKRLGKNTRLNQMFRIFTGDILIQFDADIKIENNQVVSKLVEPFLKDNQIALVLGRIKPENPKTMVEKFAYVGTDIWEEAMKLVGNNDQIYHCSGAIRAFSRNFLINFEVPIALNSEDAYSFFYAKKNQFKIHYSKDAVVKYKLPSALNDYLKQMTRFIKSEDSLERYFPNDLIKKYYSITTPIKLTAIYKSISKTPFYLILGYLLIQTLAKIKVIFYREQTTWDLSTSSKIKIS